MLENAPFFLQCLKEKLNRYREQRVDVDERLKFLESEQEQAEEELNTLQGVSIFIP